MPTATGAGADALDTSEVPARSLPGQLTARDELLQALAAAFDRNATDVWFNPGRGVQVRVGGRVCRTTPATNERLAQYVNMLADAARVPHHRLKFSESGEVVVRHRGREITCRVGFIAGVGGTAAVVRPNREGIVPLGELGFEAEQLAAIRAALAAPEGLFVVAGRARSGKTTTAYACLAEADASGELKVFQIGDPVELRRPGWVQVDLARGPAWKDAFRSALEMRADLLDAGEVRTAEEAQAVVRAALSGVRVICSLHAADAASALSRLSRMGVDGYLLGDALRLVVAQQLRRRLCARCRAEEGGYWKPAGCAECDGTGFEGLELVAEVLPANREVGAQLARGANPERVVRHAVEKDGMILLAAAEERKARRGLVEAPAAEEGRDEGAAGQAE